MSTGDGRPWIRSTSSTMPLRISAVSEARFDQPGPECPPRERIQQRPRRDTSAPPQGGDDRLLRGSAASGWIGIVAEANPALFARLRQAITDTIDRRDCAGLFERGHHGGEPAPECRTCRLEARLATLGEQLQESPWAGVNWLRSKPSSVSRRYGRARCERQAVERGEGVVEAAGALPRQPARGVELVTETRVGGSTVASSGFTANTGASSCRRTITPRAGLPRRGTHTTWPT